MSISNKKISAGILVLVLAGGGWWIAQLREPAVNWPVIIYLIDTLRADRLGLYGYDKSTSPRIDALASESVVFERANAPAPWTLPSVASILSSTFACEHGVIVDGQKLSPSFDTLPERLRSIGYATGGYYANPYVGPATGLDQGYDLYEVDWDKDALAAQVGAYLDQHASAPFFLYLHTIEPHDAFRTPGKFIPRSDWVSLDERKQYHARYMTYRESTGADSIADQPRGAIDNTEEQQQAMAALNAMRDKINALYDASIRWADSNVGAVIDELKDRGIWDEAIFILVSDHGEEFNDHGGWVHGQSVYEELVHVPLIVHFPDGEFAGRRIEDTISLLDIMPTIFDYLGRPELCYECRGASLMPRISGADKIEATVPVITSLRINRREYYRPWVSSRGDTNIVARQADWKGIWNADIQNLELYDLAHDPGELEDVSADYPDLARTLEQTASDWFSDCSALWREPEQIQDFDEEVRQQLRSLGYFN